MGVKGLMRWLQSEGAERDLCETLTISTHNSNSGPSEGGGSGAGGTILVDGFGLLIELLHRCVHPFRAEHEDLLSEWASECGSTRASDDGSDAGGFVPLPDADLVGGDLWLVSVAVRRLLDTLCGAYGLRVVFLLDGEHHETEGERETREREGQGQGHDEVGAAAMTALQDRQREAVRAARQRQRTQDLFRLYDYCDHRAGGKLRRGASHVELLPPLALTQALRAVQAYGSAAASSSSFSPVEVIALAGEVDTSIAALVAQYAPLTVLTSDTDFAVTQDVPCTFVRDLPWEQLLRRPGPGQGPRPALRLRRYSSATLCAALDVSPDQLALAATLAGNDVTHGQPAAVADGDFDRALRLAREEEAGGLPPALLADPLVQLSLRQYLDGAARAPQLPPDPSVPRGLQALAAYGSVSEAEAPLYGGAMGLRGRLAPFARARIAAAALLGHRRLHLYLDGAEEPVVLPVAVLEDLKRGGDERVWADYRAWRALRRPQRLQLLAQLFRLPSDVCGGAAATGERVFVSSVLWVAHAGLIGMPELRAVVATVCLSRLLSAAGAARADALALLRGLTERASSAEVSVAELRPTSRTMELADLFGAAFRTVADLFQLVGAWADGGEGASDSNSSEPLPSTYFSGTVLHLFYHVFVTDPAVLGHLSECAPGGEQRAHDCFIADMNALLAVLDTQQQQQQQSPGCWAFLDRSTLHPRRAAAEPIRWAGLLTGSHLRDELEEKDTGETTSVAFIAGSSSPTARRVQGLVQAAATAGVAELPAEAHVPEFLAALRAHRVVCVQGETGCGKSSVLPLRLLEEALRERRRALIVVTQPRRLAATSLAKRVASVMGEEVGKHVGYRLGGGVRCESRETALLYVTTGYLLELLAHSGDGFFSRVTHLVVDEVHERSLEADMLSLVVKMVMNQTVPLRKTLGGYNDSDYDDDEDEDDEDGANYGAFGARQRMTEREEQRECQKWWRARSVMEQARATRLVIMSATISADLFREYFLALGWSPDVPLLHVGERRYDVKTVYVDDFFEESVRQNANIPFDTRRDLEEFVRDVCNVKRKPQTADRALRSVTQFIYMSAQLGTCVLVFLPGLHEIETVFGLLDESRGRCPVPLRVHALHSVVEGAQQEEALRPATAAECKVVLSTNIAETSLTIPDVKVVIDLGYAKGVVYDRQSEMRVLKLNRCSKAAAKQRAGRAGRVSNGLCLRLYSQEVHDTQMADFNESELLPLEYSVLMVRECLERYGTVTEVMARLIEPPSAADVAAAIDKLVDWGALGPPPALRVLELGRVAVRLPIDVSMTRAVLNAVQFGCATEMVVIAAGLSLPRPLVRQQIRPFFDNDYEFQKVCGRALQCVSYFDQGRRSDPYAFLHIYEEGRLHRPVDRKSRFIQTNFLSPPMVSAFAATARSIAEKLLRLLPPTALAAPDRAVMERIVHRGDAASPSFDPAGGTAAFNENENEEEEDEEDRQDEDYYGAASTTAVSGKARAAVTMRALHDLNRSYYLQLVLAAASKYTAFSTYDATAMANKAAKRCAAQAAWLVLLNGLNANDMPAGVRLDAAAAVGCAVHDPADRSSPLFGPLTQCFGSVATAVSTQLKSGMHTLAVVFNRETNGEEWLLGDRRVPSALFRHPTALSSSVFALLHFQLIANRFGKKSGFLLASPPSSAGSPTQQQQGEGEGEEVRGVTIPQCTAAVQMGFKGVPTGYGSRLSQSKAVKLTFDPWSAVGGEGCAYPGDREESSLVVFGFNLMARGGAVQAGCGFFPFLPATAPLVEDRSFRLLTVLFANPPHGSGDTALIVGLPVPHGAVSSILLSMLNRKIDLVKVLAPQTPTLAMVVSVFIEANLLSLVPLLRAHDAKQETQLYQLIARVRQIRGALPEAGEAGGSSSSGGSGLPTFQNPNMAMQALLYTRAEEEGNAVELPEGIDLTDMDAVMRAAEAAHDRARDGKEAAEAEAAETMAPFYLWDTATLVRGAQIQPLAEVQIQVLKLLVEMDLYITIEDEQNDANSNDNDSNGNNGGDRYGGYAYGEEAQGGRSNVERPPPATATASKKNKNKNKNKSEDKAKKEEQQKRKEQKKKEREAKRNSPEEIEKRKERNQRRKEERLVKRAAATQQVRK